MRRAAAPGPGITTGQLIEQVKKLAIALDPEWARRRYEQAIADRKVVGYRNPDGSANLSGLNLPVDRVAAASGYIDALAKAAKHAGDSRPIDHIRADLFLGMTDGTYAGLDDTAILDHLAVLKAMKPAPTTGLPSLRTKPVDLTTTPPSLTMRPPRLMTWRRAARERN